MVAVTDMEDLAEALGVITVLLEMLRQCNSVGYCGAKVGPEIIDPECVRAFAGQESVA
jgi:hypothetical protein